MQTFAKGAPVIFSLGEQQFGTTFNVQNIFAQLQMLNQSLMHKLFSASVEESKIKLIYILTQFMAFRNRLKEKANWENFEAQQLIRDTFGAYEKQSVQFVREIYKADHLSTQQAAIN